MRRQTERHDVSQVKGSKTMKKIIPLFAVVFLAGCGNNSTENQSVPANPPTSEQSPSSGDTNSSGTGGESNHSPSMETVTNSLATNSNAMDTNSPTVTNQN
jgi:uncharacterized lipoprotein YajG